MAKKEEADREEGEQQEEQKPKGSKKLIIIIAVVVLVLILGGVGAFFALSGSKGGEGASKEGVESEESAEAEAPAEGEGKEGGAESGLFPLETFIVNLQIKGSFLKADIQLEFTSAAEVKKVEKDVPRLRDAIIQVLSSKTASEILTSEGKEKLKDEIRASVNSMIGEEKVLEVYFTEFIIQ